MPFDAAAVFPGSAPPDPALLDLEDGLARFDGDAAFYRELLGAMLEEAAESVVSLAALPPAERVRRVHRLRGIAGNVGARALHAQATLAERLLLEDAMPAFEAGALAELERTRTTTLSLVRSLLQAAPAKELRPAAPAPPPNAAQLERLRTALDLGHLEAADEFEGARDGYRTLLGARFDEFARAVERFDFAAARLLLPRAR